jgi:hypothetical protein
MVWSKGVMIFASCLVADNRVRNEQVQADTHRGGLPEVPEIASWILVALATKSTT